MATYSQNPYPAHQPALPPQSLPPQSRPPVSYRQQQGPQQQPQLRNQPQPVDKPRRKSRTFSFRSDKSHRSGHSYKGSLQETSAEKEARRLHSKADPTLAMNEAEPSEVAATVRASLTPLRSIQHKDAFGNPIADPDRSNPTRSRWERPLETIRSFEAAIDGEYNARKSYMRADSDSTMMRPKSNYYAYGQPRFPQESYYGGRQNSFRPENQSEPMRQRDSYFDRESVHSGAQYPSNAYHPASRQRYTRAQTEPGMSSQNDRGYGLRNGEPGVYPGPNANQRSYETVASGSGTGSSEPAGYQTDPTSGSENSSISHNNSHSKRSEPVNDYGINFNPVSSYQPGQSLSSGGANSAGPNSYYQTQSVASRPANYYSQQAPTPPPKNGPALVRPTASVTVPATASPRPSPPEKRKSWFRRRFSKNL